LYDMHGSVWEWCQDWYGDYVGGIALDPQGPNTGSDRVIRGAVWGHGDNGAWICRSADRSNFIAPEGGYDLVGFRVVLAPGQP
jgi:formylglycine-generating enzyme required for sulfatase activity